MSLTAFLDPAYARDLDALEELQRSKARDFAAECRTLVSLDSRTSGYGWQGSAPTDSLVLEIAGTCLVGQQSAGNRLADAIQLVRYLPALLGELEAGRVFVPQAKVLLDETSNLTAEVCAEVESRLLPAARETAPGPLRRKVRATILTVDAEEAARRETAAKADRKVTFRPVEDGQALLIAKGPAWQLKHLELRLTAQAKTLIAAGDSRTIDQIRFDLLAEHNAGVAGAKPGTAVIHVPVTTALGLSEAPGVLDGYGPLAASTTRELLTTAALVKVCVDSATGRVVGTDRHRRDTSEGDPETLRTTLIEMVVTPTLVDLCPEPQHDPSAALVRDLRMRDAACDGVGCSVPASMCDNDHLMPWPEGPTSFDNLRPKSQRCHHAKHNGWTVITKPDGTSHWTSPAGRTYTVPTRDRPPPGVPGGAQLPTPAELAARDGGLVAPPCATCLAVDCPCSGRAAADTSDAA